MNYLPFVSAVVANIIIGMIWYAKGVFGSSWMQLVGLNEQSMKKGMLPAMSVMLLASIVTAYILSRMILITGASTAWQGAQVSFWIWLGFMGAPMLQRFMFDQKPKKLFLIYAGFDLVSLLVMGVILTVWQ
jgi:hypothetical protein